MRHFWFQKKTLLFFCEILKIGKLEDVAFKYENTR